MRTDWLARAACKGVPTWIFFPERFGGGAAPYAMAKKVCDGCNYRFECLQLCLQETDEEMDRWGVFGGLDPHERLMVRRGYTVQRNGWTINMEGQGE